MDLETQNRSLAMAYQVLRSSHTGLRGELEQSKQEHDKAKDHLRRVAVTLALRHGLDKAAAIIFLCLCSFSLFGQTLERNLFTTNPPPLLSAVGAPMVGTNGAGLPQLSYNAQALTNVQGTSIVGTITAEIANYSDTATNVDTNTLPLGVIAWAYDANRITIGDGGTKGGLPFGVRPQSTNAYVASDATFAQGARRGEVAVLPPGIEPENGFPAFYQWTSLSLNSGVGPNWVPLIAINTNWASVIPQITTNAQGFNPYEIVPAIFSYDSGVNGTGFNPTNNFGMSGAAEGNSGSPIIVATFGSGGNSSNSGSGGNGGALAQLMTAIGGNGGNASANGATGGGGGNGGGLQFDGGNGGNAAFASRSGGQGGNAGNIVLNGGNGTDATSGANGSTGGGGGVLEASANGIFSAGTFNMNAGPNRNGANFTIYGSSYAPVTLFTTTASAGPSASASEVSLLGTAATIGAVSGQNSGKLIASNVVDHAGRTMRFSLGGFGSTNGTTATLEIKVKIGSTNALDTGPVTLATLGTGNQGWKWEGQITFRTTGSSAQFAGFGSFIAAGNSFLSTNTIVGTVDMTKDETIDCTAQFNQSDSLQCTSAIFELVN